MASHRRGPWSQGEDAYLCQLVHTQGALNWVRIAQLIGSRSPKQCRERYHQNLKPTLNHEPISPEEGLQIERMVSEMGKRWAEIARRLHGRSDNAVKNWWNGSMNRRRRLVLRRKSSQHPQTFDERNHLVSFVKPAGSRFLTITSPDYISRRGIDASLPSPAASDASRAESVDDAPSLVSDTSSSFSISPRLATSPSLELPPLSSFSCDGRRPSVLGFPFRTTTYLTEHEAPSYTFAPRLHSESKMQSSHPAALYQRPEQYHSMLPQLPREYQFEQRAHFTTALPTLVQLPPLQWSSREGQSDQPAERDSRMHLSSLLR